MDMLLDQLTSRLTPLPVFSSQVSAHTRTESVSQAGATWTHPPHKPPGYWRRFWLRWCTTRCPSPNRLRRCRRRPSRAAIDSRGHRAPQLRHRVCRRRDYAIDATVVPSSGGCQKLSTQKPKSEIPWDISGSCAGGMSVKVRARGGCGCLRARVNKADAAGKLGHRKQSVRMKRMDCISRDCHRAKSEDQEHASTKIVHLGRDIFPPS